jgi:hypothetical protein
MLQLIISICDEVLQLHTVCLKNKDARRDRRHTDWAVAGSINNNHRHPGNVDKLEDASVARRRGLTGRLEAMVTESAPSTFEDLNTVLRVEGKSHKPEPNDRTGNLDESSVYGGRIPRCR